MNGIIGLWFAQFSVQFQLQSSYKNRVSPLGLNLLPHSLFSIQRDMRKFIPCQLRYAFVRAASNLYDPPVVRIANATFYRRQLSVTPGADEASSQQGPDPTNPPLFPNLTFSIPSRNVDSQFWAVVGPSNAGKTTFLEVLRGLHLCFPPTARTYPYLATDEVAEKDPRLRYPRHAIQYVGFNAKERGLSGMGTYMSARYESRREATDFSLLDFLKGNTQLNAGETVETVDPGALQKVTSDLRLEDLLGLPVSSLSNGQTRRARIAKALLGRPEVLLLDEPFSEGRNSIASWRRISDFACSGTRPADDRAALLPSAWHGSIQRSSIATVAQTARSSAGLDHSCFDIGR